MSQARSRPRGGAPTGPPKPRMPMLLMRVWDLPTRLFHWAIVCLIVLSYVSAKAEWDRTHILSGYCVVTLLLFRLTWGFVGSETSRFGHFLRSPGAALAHLAKFSNREPDREIGHNAAGGWAVLAMLAVLCVQVGTGLFAGDPDGGGPFRNQIPEAARKTVNAVHHFNVNLIIALIVLHVVAILAYAAVKRHDLVRAMVTGRKRLPANMRQPRFVSPVFAALLVVAAALLVTLMVNFG